VLGSWLTRVQGEGHGVTVDGHDLGLAGQGPERVLGRGGVGWAWEWVSPRGIQTRNLGLFVHFGAKTEGIRQQRGHRVHTHLP
jgi:hypothetical protein